MSDFINKILEESESNIIIGFHYSNKKLSVGSIIKSNQTNLKGYDFVWEFYKKQNPNMPYNPGFAWETPMQHMKGFKYLYEVKTNSFVKGNIEFSIYEVLDYLEDIDFDFSSPIKTKDNKITNMISSMAKKYFDNSISKNYHTELLSDSWVVTKQIK